MCCPREAIDGHDNGSKIRKGTARASFVLGAVSLVVSIFFLYTFRHVLVRVWHDINIGD
jgi:hypothetical protein